MKHHFKNLMQLPYFFEENLPFSGDFILSEESSKHIAQVLRMHEGEELLVTNGSGEVINASIILVDKKKTKVNANNRTTSARLSPKVSIAISLIKNTSRFEWFLEKATEIGVSEIIPLICARTEKHFIKRDRMKNILVSAMLQSRQCWMPELKEPVKIFDFITTQYHQQKFIAHCFDGEKQQLNHLNVISGSSIILIGPEGDFTEAEINKAIENKYIPVSLGQTRLRTETAAIVAAVLLMNK